jgi:cell division septum initiation protein DivIVA
MSRYLALGVSLLAMFAISPAGLAATPRTRVVVMDATYLMADTDTLSGAEENVLTRAKRKAVEEVGVYIEASSQDFEKEVDGKTSRSNSLSVRTIAAAITTTEVLEKRRVLEGERPSFYIKIKVTVSLDALDEAVKRQHAYEQLAAQHERLYTENSQLKAELNDLRNQTQTRTLRMLSVASASIPQNQPMEIVGDYRYFYHDPMTAAEAKDLAYREAVRMAIDTAPPFMDATAFIMDSAFRRNLIQIIASGYLQDVKLVEQTQKNRTVYAKVRATMIPQVVRSVVEREVGRSSEKQLLGIGQNRP